MANLAFYLTLILLLGIALALAYLYLLAFASVQVRSVQTRSQPTHRLAITIPAHDEASIIGETIRWMNTLNYPQHLLEIHVVADHCSDATARLAREAGAYAHERNDGPRTGKGAALSWLFARILAGEDYDAVIVFDADTRVDREFLRVMDARLAQGDRVIQGQHIISNPNAGWFPALTWAMFFIDNRFQNLGRSNLGWSAKNMGDSICLHSDVLRQVGWGEGLTEDYHLRQRLLLEGIVIRYEPGAIGYGEAARSWTQARAQRMRWLRGTSDSSHQFGRRLIREGLRQRNLALLDGAVQAYLPSYSTLTLVSGLLFICQLALSWAQYGTPAFPLATAWANLTILLFLYPLLGLALEKTPWRAYLTILSGPLFIIWRTWLAMQARFGRRQVVWVRTAHGEK